MAPSLTAHLRRMKVAYGVLIIGLVSTGVIFYRVRENLQSRDQAHFERRVRESHVTIERGITRAVDQVYNIRALFAASRKVTWNEWNAYLKTMTVRHSQLGIRTLGYIEKVTPDTFPAFVEQHKDQTNFTGVLPAIPPERPFYYPSIYLTHFDSKADLIIGLDHAVKPERLAMIEQAIDQNRPTLTEKAFFMGRDGTHTNFGVFTYLPVYRSDMPLATVEQRRAAIQGLIYMTIDRETLPAILFERPGRSEVDIEVFDGLEITPNKALYNRDAILHAGEANFRATLTHRAVIPVLNRQWTIFFFTTPEFDANSPRYLQWLALLGGVIISSFLFAITCVQVNARDRAELDAEELHKSEAALAAEKERLAVTLESIAEGVITTNAAEEIVSLNHVAERLTGWSQAEAVGRPLSEVFCPVNDKTRQPRADVVGEVLRADADSNSEQDALLISRDGTERIITDSAAPIHLAGKIIGAVLVFRDFTEKRRNEEELLKESKLESVGLLAGGIAHDFNNILTGIIGNISLARMSAHSTEKMLDRLSGVEKSAFRAKDLTQQLLTFAKGGAPIRKWAQIPELVKDVCQFTLHGSTVQCEYSLPPDIWPVELDEGQFRQALNHLVINAMQAMPDGGQMEVKLENVELTEGFLPPLAAGKYVKLSIRDHGPGIEPKNLSRIFEPYFTPKRAGNGLGMATAYSVVRKHEGQIRVESTIGVGSVFHVYLPATFRAVQPVTSDVNQKEFFGHGRVLIMDDEPDVLEIAGHMLRMCGYEVETVRDGADVIERYIRAKAAGQPFDAVIMDLTVPNGMGGREAIRRLKELAPEIKAIVSSGYSFDPVMANYRQYGFRGIIPKPYQMEELGRVLRDVIAGAAVEN